VSELTEQQAVSTRVQVGFWLAVLFLLLIAQILPHGGTSDRLSALYLGNPWVLGVIFTLWGLIVIDALLGLLRLPDGLKPTFVRCAINCLVPPSRMTVSPAWRSDQIWLPKMGWQACTQDLFTHLEFKLTLPMLIITLLILPVMAVELLMTKQLEQSTALAAVVHHITSLIWAAFTAEFILLVSVARKKLDYCKKNWINIVIIVLPLVAFLRTLRLFRVLKLAKAGKLARAYRLRGLLVRAQRLALLFNLIERFLHRNPEKYLVTLREREENKRAELAELQLKIQSLEREVAAQKDS
jgi:voltage-gated potassium channel